MGYYTIEFSQLYLFPFRDQTHCSCEFSYIPIRCMVGGNLGILGLGLLNPINIDSSGNYQISILYWYSDSGNIWHSQIDLALCCPILFCTGSSLQLHLNPAARRSLIQLRDLPAGSVGALLGSRKGQERSENFSCRISCFVGSFGQSGLNWVPK